MTFEILSRYWFPKTGPPPDNLRFFMHIRPGSRYWTSGITRLPPPAVKTYQPVLHSPNRRMYQAACAARRS
jgi:hypothetical protein